jgi:hypothetical protein
MSLVSMLGPSPDWIVGVSALELCSRNCTWVENKTLNLYPWDAGTDSGITYTVRIDNAIALKKKKKSDDRWFDTFTPFFFRTVYQLDD